MRAGTQKHCRKNRCADYFLFHIELLLTVVVPRGRIYGNIGYYLAINFDINLIDTITEIFVVFRGNVVIFPKAFFKIDFPAFVRRSGTFWQIFRFSRRDLLLNYAACRRGGFGRTYRPAARRKNEWCSKGNTDDRDCIFKIKSIIDNLLG